MAKGDFTASRIREWFSQREIDGNLADDSREAGAKYFTTMMKMKGATHLEEKILMQSNANNIVKALIVALGLLLGGTAKAATLNDHLKIDPSANTVHVFNLAHVTDGIDAYERVTRDHRSVANRTVGNESVHLARDVQAILKHEKVEAIGVNRLHANIGQDLHMKMLNGVQVGIPNLAQTPCSADPVGNLQLRC